MASVIILIGVVFFVSFPIVVACLTEGPDSGRG